VRRLTFRAGGTIRDGVFTPAAKRLVEVEVWDGDRVIDRFPVNPSSPRSRKQAERYGPGGPDVIRLCDESLKDGERKEWAEQPQEQPLPKGHLTVTVRNADGSDAERHTGHAAELLPRLLPEVPVDRLLVWTGRDTLCCLDIDYHATAPPIRSHLEAWLERLSPRPLVWHFSRGGGAHCFYVATDRFTAEELAAAAAIRFRTVDGSAGLDLVTSVRGAGGERLRVTQGGGDGAGALPGADEVSEDAVDEWLDSRQMQVGGRYDHTLCPINPTDTGKNLPVSVCEAGVWCWVCAAKGFSLGSRRAGFASFAALTGTAAGNEVAAMVENRVHWGHARWVLTEKYERPETLARLGYAAALKARHEDLEPDELAACFSDDTADMARANDSWVNLLSGSYHYPSGAGLNSLLGLLPGCLGRDDKGRLRPVASRVAYMGQGHDLAARGYKNITVVRGVRVTKQFLPVSDRTLVSVVERELRGSPRTPKYLQRSGRKPVEWAEGVFESHFPGLSWVALRSQVCAAVIAQETGVGMTPMTFISGTTGAAKTTTVKLAAGILGTSAPDVTYLRDGETLKRAIGMAGTRGAFALCNEFLKDHQRANTGRFDPKAAMETLLNLTPEVLVHVLHVGPRPLGKLPAIVLTEPNCPYQLRGYGQVARRVRHVKLFGQKKSWKESLAALNLTPGTIHLYRLRDPELAEAADVILSDLTDQYFAAQMSWDTIADSLGCPTIQDSTDFDNPDDDLREFFRLVCEAPGIKEARVAKQYPGGYKRVHRADGGDDAGPLVDKWNQFCDRDWFNSKLLDEAPWNDLIGSTHEVQLDVKNDQVNSVFVRFRVGPSQKPLFVNGAIPRKLVETKEPT